MWSFDVAFYIIRVSAFVLVLVLPDYASDIKAKKSCFLSVIEFVDVCLFKYRVSVRLQYVLCGRIRPSGKAKILEVVKR